MGDVLHVHEELVVRIGVVAAEDLRVAGETGLRLQAEGELRHDLFIGVRKFGALRAGADEGHVALQDVDQLRDLVQAVGPEEASDPCESRIVFASGETGYAVLLRVRAHAAELQYEEPPVVFGEPSLPVQDRPAVIEGDRDSDRQHDRRQNDQTQEGSEDVEDSLDEKVERRRVVPLDAQHRQVQHVDRLRALHDRVADTGDHVGDDAFLNTIFRKDIALVAVDTAEKNGLRAFEHGLFMFDAVLHGRHGGHFEALVQAVLPDHVVEELSAPSVPDHDGLHRREGVEVPAVGSPAPEGGAQELHGQDRKHRGEPDGLGGQQCQDHVLEDAADHGRQHLAVDQLGDPAQRDQEGRVDPSENTVESCVQADDRDVPPEIEGHPDPRSVILVPDGRERQRHQHDVEGLHEPQAQLPVDIPSVPLTRCKVCWHIFFPFTILSCYDV